MLVVLAVHSLLFACWTRTGCDDVATVRRGPATVARRRWRYADEDDLTGWIAAELPQWQTAVLEAYEAFVIHKLINLTIMIWGQLHL